MATRRETFQRRSQLLHSLRERHASGELRAGEPAPSVRQLAVEFGLSNTVVAGVLGELVGEGLFHTRPRAGTFVGPAAGASGGDPHTFLLVMGPSPDARHDHRRRQIEMGFEARVAQLGGAVLVMDEGSAQERFERGLMPELIGLAQLSAHPARDAFWNRRDLPAPLPRVCYGNAQFRPVHDELGYDTIGFNNERGGAEATRHLLARGHRRIGFFGWHCPWAQAPDQEWSAQREEGWRLALEEAGLSSDGLAFHPAELSSEALDAAAHMFGRALTTNDAPTALVAANDEVARRVLDALAMLGVPSEHWPSVVGFDAERDGREELVSSLQLPWDGFGRLAADLLWERHQGRLPTQAQHRLLPMQLVPRLTCRRNWSRFNTQTLPVAA